MYSIVKEDLMDRFKRFDIERSKQMGVLDELAHTCAKEIKSDPKLLAEFRSKTGREILGALKQTTMVGLTLEDCLETALDELELELKKEG